MTRMSLADRREKLLDAALEVVARTGVASATTRAIAAQAGMPLASFHYAFDSHQALMIEAIERLQSLELAACEGLEVAGGSRQAIARSLMDSVLADIVARTNQHWSRLELLDHAMRTEGMQELAPRWRRARLDCLGRKVAAAAEGVEGLQGEDLAQFTTALVVMADGLLQDYLVHRDEQLSRRAMDVWLALLG